MPVVDESGLPLTNRPVLPTALVRSASGQVASPVTAVSTPADQPSVSGGGTGGSKDVSTPTVFAIIGKRTDLPEGVGTRFRIGLDGPGTAFVIERWSEGGTKTSVTFS